MSLLLRDFLSGFTVLGHSGGVLSPAQPIVWGAWRLGHPPERALSKVGTRSLHPSHPSTCCGARRLLSKTAPRDVMSASRLSTCPSQGITKRGSWKHRSPNCFQN